MTRQTAGMWETEVHLAQGSMLLKSRVMLMEGTYIGRVSGEVLISGGGQIATADDPVCVQSP